MTASITLATPTLLTPSASTVSTNAGTLSVALTADVNTSTIKVTVGGAVRYLPVVATSATSKTFAGEVALPAATGSYPVVFVAQDSETDPTQISGSLTLTAVVASMEEEAEAVPPAAIRVLRLFDRVRIEWQSVDTPGFQGVRVRWSTDSSGVTVPYTQFGGLVPNNNIRSEAVTLSSNSTTALDVNATKRTTTTVEQLATIRYSAVDILASDVNVSEFYVTLATVVQDADTHHVYESVAAGPLRCTFVDLQQVSPTDLPPTVQPEQIAQSLIATITAGHGNLDLSPRSEIRDLQIDPFALEQANASIRGWFTRTCASLSALVAVDDTDGDGVSDPVSTSPYKQMIARAFRLTDVQVQAVIDTQFDIKAESAGIQRKGAEAAIIPVTFYVTVKPKSRITIALGSTVSTVPDDTTPSLTYSSLGSAVIDPSNLSAYWLPDVNGWGVVLLCQCQTASAASSVGAGTIENVLSGTSQTMKCTNLTTATFDGRDRESNAELAARIFCKRETGVDSGTSGGYKSTTLACKGVTAGEVVGAGDLDMLRDWDPIRDRHTYGCVDIYARGAAYGQANESIPYFCQTDGTPGLTATFVPLTFAGRSGNRMKFLVTGGVTLTPSALVCLYIARAGGAYLGTQTAVWDPTSGAFYLNPTELSYTLDDTGAPVYGAANTTWITSLTGATISGVIRYWSPFSSVAKNQPVTSVASVVGDGDSGAIPSGSILLDRSTSDPLLEGNSSRSKDRITVVNDTVEATIPVTWATNGEEVISLDRGVVTGTLQLSKTGVPSPGNVLSVRSQDASTLYAMNTDYALVTLGPYGHVGIRRAENSSIPLDTPVLVSYNKRRIAENVTLRTETVTLTGTTSQVLSHSGFVHNVWLPISHEFRDLVDDTDLTGALVPYINRYLKVTSSTGKVYREGTDFTLSVDAGLSASMSRFVSGSTVYSGIADGETVTVTYYTVETFDVVYTYPQYLTQVTTALAAMKHGGADTLAKAMVATPVDLELTVILEDVGTATPTVMDPKVRTAISLAISLASTRLSQSDIVYMIQALTGVSRVSLPLTRMTRADGSHVIGEVIPTSTIWESASALNLPSSFTVKPGAWVTASPVLKFSTRPSGGVSHEFVGLLYEGTSFARCNSLAEFAAATVPSFYLIGLDDQLNTTTPIASQHYRKVLLYTPDTTANPNQHAYRVTYQVFGEASVQDIEVSPLEYLVAGSVTVSFKVEA